MVLERLGSAGLGPARPHRTKIFCVDADRNVEAVEAGSDQDPMHDSSNIKQKILLMNQNGIKEIRDFQRIKSGTSPEMRKVKYYIV